jgi:uncharacterized membrane protein YcaP (DUF421 family)
MIKITIGDRMDYVTISLKIIIIYFLLIIILRILGKREVGQLSIFDLVILLIVADVAAIGIDNREFFLPSILCLLILTALQKLVSLLLLNVPKLREILDGTPTIIVFDGIIKYKNMKKEFYNIDDLIVQMRVNNIADVSDIKLAILENNGKLSIFKKEHSEFISYPLIASGKYCKDTLEVLRISQEDIDNILKNNNLAIKNILYASYRKGTISYYERSSKEEDITMKKLSLK